MHFLLFGRQGGDIKNFALFKRCFRSGLRCRKSHGFGDGAFGDVAVVAAGIGSGIFDDYDFVGDYSEIGALAKFSAGCAAAIVSGACATGSATASSACAGEMDGSSIAGSAKWVLEATSSAAGASAVSIADGGSSWISTSSRAWTSSCASS